MEERLSYQNVVQELLLAVPEFIGAQLSEAEAFPDVQLDFFYSFVDAQYENGLSTEASLSKRIIAFIDRMSLYVNDEPLREALYWCIIGPAIHENRRFGAVLESRLSEQGLEQMQIVRSLINA